MTPLDRPVPGADAESPASATRSGRVAAALAVVAFTILPAALALANEETGEHRERSTALLVLAFINFAIYAYIIYRFAWPAIVKYLVERRDSVVAALDAAAKATAEAEAQKAEFAARMKTLEEDAAKMRAEVLAVAQLGSKELIEQAKRSAERIRRDARLVADQEVARARRLLQEESARLVARAAGAIVSKNLTAADQARFVADFVAEAREALAVVWGRNRFAVMVTHSRSVVGGVKRRLSQWVGAAGLVAVSCWRVATSMAAAPFRTASMSIPWRYPGTSPTADISLVRPPTQSHIGNRASQPSF